VVDRYDNKKYDFLNASVKSSPVKSFSDFNLSYGTSRSEEVDRESNKENGEEESNVLPLKRKSNMNLSMTNFVVSKKNVGSSSLSPQRKTIRLEDSRPNYDWFDEDGGVNHDPFDERPSLVDDNSSKKLTTFFNPSGNAMSYMNSLLSSPQSLSFVQKSIFKGGIRNLGNSCYMSSIIQSLLVLEEFKKDINSLFWSNIFESQLIIQSALPEMNNDNQSRMSEMPSLLPERVLFRNENSCLSELISLLR
jgi:hypothetical protein